MGLRQSLADFLKNRNNLNYDEPIDQGNSIFDRIVPRTEWGAIDVAYPKSQESWEMDIEKNEIVIHHSANFYKGPMWIDLNHYFKQWGGVGYHFMIDSKGTIYEGRPLDMKDVHVENANTGKIGIVLFGNFDPNSKISGKPSSQQLESMWALAAVLQEDYGIERLTGHKDFKPTTVCPGSILYDIIYGTGEIHLSQYGRAHGGKGRGF